ncbi:MAG: ASKHA domain-containing protein [Lachnospiraceae bacterium]
MVWAAAPFTPYEIKDLHFSLKDWFAEASEKTAVHIYPGISTFVGADIVAGICALDISSSEKPVMLIDLGTNGEMALGNRDRLLATSVAAGPAFEGGNIICGTGSIPGAVCGARWENGGLKIGTIQDAPPEGICGTGAVEIIAELVKAEIIDETGRMEDPWFTEGYPVAKSDAWREATSVCTRKISGNCMTGQSGGPGRDRDASGKIRDQRQ